MSVRLKNRGPNQTIIDFGDAGEVLFSYETPVAGRHPRMGMVRTTQFYSPTTSKHVNGYLGASGTMPASAQAVPQEFFDEWLAKIGDTTSETRPTHTPNGYSWLWIDAINGVMADREADARIADLDDDLWERWIGPMVDELESAGGGDA